MRKNPILELAAGLATPAAALIMPIRMITYVGWDSFMGSHTSELINMFGIPLALAICVALGSILDFYFRHGLAFWTTCVFCISTVIYSGFWAFFFLIWGGPLNGLLMFSPGIFALLTIIFGIRWRIHNETIARLWRQDQV